MAAALLCWCVGSFALAPVIGRAMRKPRLAIAGADDGLLLSERQAAPGVGPQLA